MLQEGGWFTTGIDVQEERSGIQTMFSPIAKSGDTMRLPMHDPIDTDLHEEGAIDAFLG